METPSNKSKKLLALFIGIVVLVLGLWASGIFKDVFQPINFDSVSDPQTLEPIDLNKLPRER